MKLKSTFKNMFLSLTGIALVAAFLLSAVYMLTKETIDNAKLAKQQEAIRNVLPLFDRFESDTVGGLMIYKAYQNDKFAGAAVESSSLNGFGGEIKIIVGFDTAGNIINYNVLEQKETPGLGTKIVDWFKTPNGDQSIIGKNPANLKVKKDGGSVDAITASTISSRAFLEAVVSAYNAYAGNIDATDAYTSATQKVEQPDIKTDSTADLQSLPVKKRELQIRVNEEKKTALKVDAVTQATSSSWEEPKPEPVMVKEKKTDTVKQQKDTFGMKQNSVIPEEEIMDEFKDELIIEKKDTTPYE